MKERRRKEEPNPFGMASIFLNPFRASSSVPPSK